MLFETICGSIAAVLLVAVVIDTIVWRVRVRRARKGYE